jgi:hypothetical protein
MQVAERLNILNITTKIMNLAPHTHTSAPRSRFKMKYNHAEGGGCDALACYYHTYYIHKSLMHARIRHAAYIYLRQPPPSVSYIYL